MVQNSFSDVILINPEYFTAHCSPSIFIYFIYTVLKTSLALYTQMISMRISTIIIINTIAMPHAAPPLPPSRYDDYLP